MGSYFSSTDDNIEKEKKDSNNYTGIRTKVRYKTVQHFSLNFNKDEDPKDLNKEANDNLQKLHRKRNRFKSTEICSIPSLEKLMPLKRHKNSLDEAYFNSNNCNDNDNNNNNNNNEDSKNNIKDSDNTINPIKKRLSRKDSIEYCSQFKEKYKNQSKIYINKLRTTLERYKGLPLEEKLRLKKLYMPDYIIDWVLETNELNGTRTWRNKGKIPLDKSTLNELKFNTEKIIGASEPFYKKRAWFLQYLFVNFSKEDYIDNNDNDTENNLECNLANPILVINRNNIVRDSYYQYMQNNIILSRPIRIFFVDEYAHDDGGVYRDWYNSLINAIFDEKSKLFIVNKNNSLERDSYLFYPQYEGIDYGYYEFIGKLLIKAVVDMISIKYKLNRVLIKHIIHRPVTIDDIKYYDMDLYNSLSGILFNNIDEKYKNLYMTWNIRDEKGNLKEIELVPNGKNIPISEDNKETFVEKVIYYETYDRFSIQILSFSRGIKTLLDDRLQGLFSLDELSLLLRGAPEIDLDDWKSNTIYVKPYCEEHNVVKMFWNIVEKMKEGEKEKLLEFATGCCGVPVDGFCCLKGVGGRIQKFCIAPMSNNNNVFRLIEAKTCFNRIYIPEYKNIEEMEKAINIILTNDTNFFGLE